LIKFSPVLNPPNPLVEAADEQPHFRKIHVPTGMSLRGSGMLSPDGQRMAFISDGSLWVVPIHGKSDPNIAGFPVRLTEPMHAWDVGNVSIAWSGDGGWIGFRVATPKTGAKGSATRVAGGHVEELYMVPSEGREPIRLPITWEDWAGDVDTLRYAFSYDAGTLYFAEGTRPEELRIYSMSVNGGDKVPLTEPITREPAVSPDGSKIAYVKMQLRPSDGRLDTHEVWMKSLDGGKPVLVCKVSDPAWLRSPIWSPDGSMIAFLSSAGHPQGGNRHRQVWTVRLSADEKRVSPPSKFDLPTDETSDLLAGWTENNRIGVLLPTPMSSPLYTVPATGGKATQLTPKDATLPSWSPEGKSIYFGGDHGGKLASIEVVPAEGGDVKRIPIELEGREGYLQPHYPSGGIRVSPDGRSVLFAGHYVKVPGEKGLFTIPIEGGKPVRLPGSLPVDADPCWSPDGRNIAYVRFEEGWGDDPSTFNVFVLPSEGGEPRAITTAEDNVHMGAVRWSPDGELIAFLGRDKTLRVVPVNGGPSRLLAADLDSGLWHQGISWSPDGQALAYATGSTLWRIPRDGGEPKKIETGLNARIGRVDWSPDGESIAFAAFKGGEHELWLMEDFLHLVSNE
jgi:Tol biopolymer transport system component